jgi:hypothetical protein
MSPLNVVIERFNDVERAHRRGEAFLGTLRGLVVVGGVPAIIRTIVL